MHPHNLVFAIVTLFHDLFTIIWLGGMVTMALITMPAARAILGKGPELKKLMRAIQKRQNIFVYICMAGLALTGFLLSKRNPSFTGLFSFANTFSILLSLKHLAMIAMIIIALYRNFSLGLPAEEGKPKDEKASFLLLIINITLGFVVLALTGLLAAYGV